MTFWSLLKEKRGEEGEKIYYYYISQIRMNEVLRKPTTTTASGFKLTKKRVEG